MKQIYEPSATGHSTVVDWDQKTGAVRFGPDGKWLYPDTMKEKSSGEDSPFTREEHKELGNKLWKIQRTMTRLYVDLMNRHSRKSRAGKLAGSVDTIVASLRHIRSEMEEQMLNDYPDMGLDVYYRVLKKETDND